MSAERASGRRAQCVWLGTLASWRQGLVGRLVREYGGVSGVLERSPAELAAFLTSRRAVRAAVPGSPASSGAPAAADADAASDARRFADVLAGGPEACLRDVERGRSDELVVAWSDALYPAQLRRLTDPPLALFARGGAGRGGPGARLSALAAVPSVAVVGTRAPSPYGEDMARLLGRDLSLAGLVVVSGMALGIDAVAQSAAVEVGAGGDRPSTVAVLGCGADVVYPRRHARLYAAIVASGLILSEFAWGVPARAWRFPARNRVMAALSRGVVLVEGTERSGARITAGFALDLGREILCVPGEAGRRLSAAPNHLLRDGAKMCESAADVLRAIAVDAAPGGADERAQPAGDDPWEALVLDHGEGAVRDVLRALTSAPLSVDELTTRCRLPAHKVAAAVSELEVDGIVRRVDGAKYRLLRP